MSILNEPEISKAYFFPQDVRCDDAIEVDVGGAVLRCYHHIGNQDGRTLIHFHGNGEGVGHYTVGNYPAMLSREMNGINVLMVEYRGYGGSTGEVEMVSMLPDGQRVMEQLSIDPTKTIAYGRSIGSLYALELAKRVPNLAGLVIESGIADIEERFLAREAIVENVSDWDEVTKQIQLHFNHRAKIEAFRGNVLILHTARDGLVSVTNADRLYEWAINAAFKKYTVFMRGNHNTIHAENDYSINLHLKYLERDLFADSGVGSEKLKDIPMTHDTVDRGAMLEEEWLEAKGKANPSSPKPNFLSKLKTFFTSKS